MRQLETFLAVAAVGSFGRVAARMHVSQPTVSARIAALEAELGGGLFDRGPNGAQLTELGEGFLPYADRAVAALQDGRRATATGTSAAPLTLGVSSGLSAGVFATALSDLLVRLPDVRLRVLTAESGELRRLLADRTVEAIYTPWPPILDDFRVRTQVLHTAEEPLVLVTGPTHALASLPDPLDLPEAVAAARPFIDVPIDYDQRISRLAAGSPAPAVIEVESIGTAKVLLTQGIGAALLTPSIAEPELSAGQLISVPLLEPRRRRAALVRLARPAPPGPTLQAFLDALKIRSDPLD